MQIAYHLGVHCTDDDRLVRALLKNRGTLAASGIAVPTPRLYRQLLPKVAKSLRGARAGSDAQHVILDAVLDDTPAERVVFSHDSLLTFPVNAVSVDGLYATAPQRIEAYANLFPGSQTEFFMALRNPATLIPALIARLPDASYETLMAGISPASLRWAPVIRRVLERVPEVNLTIWCNEDSPLLWPEILRAVAGVGQDQTLDGDFDLLATIMSDEGLDRIKAFFDSHPPHHLAQRRRATAAFLEKYARADEMEVEIDLPGWSEELVEAMTAGYDADCAEIASLPGVVFLTP